MRLRAIYPVLVGLLLGTLQTGLYFQLTFTLSSGFGTYLMVTLCWLTGQHDRRAVARSPDGSRRWRCCCWPLALMCSVRCCCSSCPSTRRLVPLYAGLIVLVGLYPGVFFARTSPLYPISVLFFRENNGFIVGLALGTLLFMLLGRPALWFPPLLLIACLMSAVAYPNALRRLSRRHDRISAASHKSSVVRRLRHCSYSCAHWSRCRCRNSLVQKTTSASTYQTRAITSHGWGVSSEVGTGCHL